MKKLVVAAAMAMAAWSGSSMAGAGLGMSIQSGDPTVYIPIDVSPAFRLEPFINYISDKSEQSVFEPSSTYTVREVTETTSYRFGVGLFGSTGFGESVRAYFGGRLAYVSTESEFGYDGGSRPFGFPTTSEKIEYDGYSIEPTIGLEYRFTERFSIAGEAALIIGEVDGDEISAETTRTDTNVVVRFMF